MFIKRNIFSEPEINCFTMPFSSLVRHGFPMIAKSNLYIDSLRNSTQHSANAEANYLFAEAKTMIYLQFFQGKLG